MINKEYGWIVFILRCADDSYYSGICKDLDKELQTIHARRGYYFSTHPERLPAQVAFSERITDFREAYAKSLYLREMTRRLRTKLIETKIWPCGGALKKYLLNKKSV